MNLRSFAGKVLSRLDRLDREQIENFVQGQLREQRTLEAALDLIGDGVVVVDPAGKISFLNVAAREILSIGSARRCVGEHWRRLVNTDELSPLRELLEQADAVRASLNREPVLLRSPRALTLEVSVFHLDEDDVRRSPRSQFARMKTRASVEHPRVWILHDTGDRERTRDASDRERSVEFLTTLTAGLAHEIRNPLNSLGIHASVLRAGLREVARDPAAADVSRLQRSTEVFQEELSRLGEIVKQFLIAARPVRLDRRPTRLGDLLEAVAELLRPECAQRKITLTLETDPDLPPVPVDAGQLRQVVLNLAKNAVEAIPAGDPGRVTLRCALARDHALITVTDTGIGIKPEDKVKIFEPYYTTKENGSGLGLMVVWRIVRAHGGALAIDSAPGRGTTFSLALPLDARPIRLLENSLDAGDDRATESQGDARES